MVYFFKTPSPKAGQSVRFASSPAKSSRQLLGPTNLKSTVSQYLRTDHTNTVMWFSSIVVVEYIPHSSSRSTRTLKMCSVEYYSTALQCSSTSTTKYFSSLSMVQTQKYSGNLFRLCVECSPCSYGAFRTIKTFRDQKVLKD